MARTITWISHERYDENAVVNLICFPYAGGSASFFTMLKEHTDPSVNICPVLYPGREKNMGIAAPDSIEELANRFVDENERLFTKPYAILGHCTGALAAYEAALAAEKKYGAPPVRFFASSAPAPSCGQFFPDLDISDEEMTAYLVENGMIDEKFASDSVFISYFLPLMRKDLGLHLKYRPAEPYRKMDTEVIVMYGSSDRLFGDKSAILRWKDFAEKGVRSFRFEGGHFYIDKCRSDAGKLISQLLGV